MWDPNHNQQYGTPSFPAPQPNSGYAPGYSPSYSCSQPGFPEPGGYGQPQGPPPGSGYGSPSGHAPPFGPPSGYGPMPGHAPPPYHPPGHVTPSGPPPGHAPPGFPLGHTPPPGPPLASGPPLGHAPPGHAPPPGPPGRAPPPGPPPGHARPPGAPPGYRPNAGHAPPSGPPPNQYSQSGQYQSGPPSSYAPQRPPAAQQMYGPAGQGGAQHFFQYSQCTGRKRALCIGINYIGQEGALGGCINDAMNMRNFLCRRYGYKSEDIVVLRDDSQNPKEKPTKENMIKAMHWLVQGARPNDSLFFHYSGHGGQTKDLTGDEQDGYDEVVYPLDFKVNGHIVDDDMHSIMVKPLPPGCRLTAIFDSCHSGTALDLPYVYSTEGKIKEPNLLAEAGQGLLSAVSSYARGDLMGAFKGAAGLVKVASGNTQRVQAAARATKTSPADVISWSGCKDSQTSADTQEAGEATGAMSYAFITATERNPQQSYQQLLMSIREILRAKYSQKPQLSCSHPMDTNILFIC